MNKILYFYAYFSMQNVKHQIKNYFNLLIFTLCLSLGLKPNVGLAQIPREDQQQEQTPLPELPSPQDLFQFPSTPPTPPTPEALPKDIPGKITVNKFNFEGSTVFSDEQLQNLMEGKDIEGKSQDENKNLIGKPITFSQLQQAADRITKLYTQGCNNNQSNNQQNNQSNNQSNNQQNNQQNNEGNNQLSNEANNEVNNQLNDESKKPCYVNSGAYIPAKQTFKADGGDVTIKIVEGILEDIEVTGTKRLNPSYVRSRLSLSKGKPLNLNKVLEALQLLQLDPLIKNLRADLGNGVTPGASVLAVDVTEAKTWSVQVDLNNNRQPSIGSFERKIQVNQANLLGLGDGLSVAYANTDGSNSVDVSYTLPLNPRDGTLTFNYSGASSDVVEEPFDVLDIEGSSQEYGITYRQPLIRTPNKEFALSFSASRRNSDIGFLEALTGERFPFPSPGADEDGETRATILRFAQEWTQRSANEVLAARSQLSLGIDALNATTDDGDEPDGEFFTWRGQAQWVRRLARDTLFIARGNLQLADRPILPSEQIGVGGQSTVRGYRQDQILADNAFLASAELRYPIWRVPQVQGVLQVTPFIDFGTAWNRSQANRSPIEEDSLASVGLGLLWQQEHLSARLDWGIPLVSIDTEKDSWQENGVYFSIFYNQPF